MRGQDGEPRLRRTECQEADRVASGALGDLATPQELFHVGTAVGLGDAQLLARYAASRDEAAFEALVARHQRSAEPHGPSLKRKRVTPHVLRHTAAMQLLRDGIDRSVIALWLEHESVETPRIYPHADAASRSG
jgi:hypothetical protein